jgi:hypothetical protein
MSRLSGLAAALGLAAGVALACSSAGAQDANPSVKDIMTRAHKGANSLLATIGKGLRSSDPNWSDLQAKSQELVRLGTSLGKNEPPQGPKPSWDKLTRQYLDTTKNLETAAESKDKEAALAAHKGIVGSCKACHQVHKPG